MLKTSRQVSINTFIENENTNVSLSITGGMMCGWLPIFDTMNGVRGEVNVQVIFPRRNDTKGF